MCSYHREWDDRPNNSVGGIYREVENALLYWKFRENLTVKEGFGDLGAYKTGIQ
jgi:hypothetical protein